MQCADTAMYRAKASGRNAYRFYDPQMNVEASERSRLRWLLAHAIERDELHLHFQPYFHLRGGELAGAEVLLRWTSAELGNVGPDQFIPVAEDGGQIVEIGAWVLRRACAQAAAWLRAGPRAAQRRGQPVDPAVPPRRPGAPGGRRAARIGPAAAPAGARDHRVRADARDRQGARHRRPPQGAGRAPGHRRLRHRLLQPGLPAAAERGQAQDRPVLRAQRAGQQEHHRHRARDHRDGAARWSSRSWPKASRPTPSARSSRPRSARWARATCSRARCRRTQFEAFLAARTPAAPRSRARQPGRFRRLRRVFSPLRP